MWGQMLGANGFVQLHAGYEIPSDRERGADEGFVRTAFGYTLAQDRGVGRAWSPMAEVLVARPEGGPAEWDVVPQVQVSLSKLQHVLLNVGVRVPLTQRDRTQAAAAHLCAVGLVRRRPVPVLEVDVATRTSRPSVACCRCRAPAGCCRCCWRAGARDGAQAAARPSTPHRDLSLFTHSDDCVACHNNLTTASGRGRLDRRRRGGRR